MSNSDGDFYGGDEEISLFTDLPTRTMHGFSGSVRVRVRLVRFDFHISSFYGVDTLKNRGDIYLEDGTPLDEDAMSEWPGAGDYTYELLEGSTDAIMALDAGIGIQPFYGLISPYVGVGYGVNTEEDTYIKKLYDPTCHTTGSGLESVPGSFWPTLRVGNTFYFFQRIRRFNASERAEYGLGDSFGHRYAKGIDVSAVWPIGDSPMGPMFTASLLMAMGGIK